ncbi:hypothetical protein [Streptomyces sp. BSE7-9]|uniref:hypothetical protein n=1 Tax=Streptomyces sp. BSE7-9 TaxID=2759948 RepID=UPI0018EE8517|nr:hypothetical protein [Streptomyces sp. BSE7-9]MBJ6644096.1 hypothetical protein [Streptomyces sp. BSE7-9]
MPENQYEDPFEDRFASALRDTGHSFRTDDPAALVGRGEVRGRRKQLLRRTAVLGGMTGVALVGVGATLLLTPEVHDPRRTSAAAGPAATASPSAASPSPAAAFTGDDMLRSLKELLPQGTYSKEQAQGTGSTMPPYARLVFDDGEGAAALGLSVDRMDPGGEQAAQWTTCPDKAVVAYDDCTSATQPDGSRLMLLRGYEYPDRRVDTKWWNAELVTPDGVHVTLSEWNAPAQRGAPVSRPQPPLSVEQLKEVVTAHVWRQVAAAVPHGPKPSVTGEAPPEGRPSGAIADTLTGLLTEDLKVTDESGPGAEYAYLVVDDGKGGSLVQINVQPGMSDMAGVLFEDAEKLADGRLVTTRQSPGEKGAEGVVMWTADTLRPDGLRVVVSAFNTPAQHQDATRDTPALTMEQLREIALSTVWDAGA